MNSVSLFTNKGQFNMGVATPLDKLVAEIQTAIKTRGPTVVSRSVSDSAMSLEAISEGSASELSGAVDELNSALEGIYNSHVASYTQPGKTPDPITTSQKNAASAAAILASNPMAAMRIPSVRQIAVQEGMDYLVPMGAEFADRMQPALEAYDERENKNAVTYSVAYNMQAARQDEFGEAFFPTVVVTPDQVGIAVSIRLVEVYNEQRRAVSGAAASFGRRNIIAALIDPSILKNDNTNVVPVVRTESTAMFVSSALVAPYNKTVGEEVVSTAPLKMGARLSLIGISQTDALLETGLMDSTDALDSAIVLAKLYLQVTDSDGSPKEIFSFSTARLAGATFNHAVQGTYRQMVLNFESDALKVGGGAVIPKMNNGTNSTLLADTDDYTVRLKVAISGSVNLETSELYLMAGDVTVASVTDVDGVQLPLDSGQGQTIKNLFAYTTAIGYDLDAQRTNSNRRQRGQLLNTQYYNQIYAVPLRAPITCPRPLTAGDANDSSDLAALITTTHVRTSNAAVDELFKIDDMLNEYVSAADAASAAPSILGVARFLVTPTYKRDTLNVAATLDSLTSTDRMADLAALLVNKVRNMAVNMYRDSGYKAAADALAGGQSQAPTIIVGTDPVIANYLMTSGDFRTLGAQFQLKIVSTLNKRMKGKIFVTFGDFASGKDGVPNPMHFGNMAWKPELTLVLPIHRNGGNSKELTVQPSFLHIANLPVLGRIDVSGIDAVAAGKVTVNTSN